MVDRWSESDPLRREPPATATNRYRLSSQRGHAISRARCASIASLTSEDMLRLFLRATLRKRRISVSSARSVMCVEVFLGDTARGG